MKKTARAVIPLLTAPVLLAGCGSTSLSGSSQLEEEVRELKARVIELQRKAAVSEVEIARLRAQVTDLEAAGTRSSPAPPAARTERESRPPAVEPPPSPPAVIEETDLDDETLASLDDEVLDEEAVDLFEETEPVSASPAVVPEADLPTAGQALYDRGYTLYHQGEYLDAEAAFRRFLEDYPGTDLADNAQYWIGESRFARKDLRGALAAFRETVNRYPEGNKVPDALLKSGQVLEDLGDLNGARQSYRDLQRRFPDSAAAIVASERLEHL